MKKTLGAFLLFLLSSAFKARQINPRLHVELARLRMSLAYVRAIKTFRLLFLSLLGMGVCLIFLAAGLILFHVTLFLYTPWSTGTKCLIGLLCSGFYLLVTLVILYQIFASDKWLKIFHAHTIMDHLQNGAEPRESVHPN